MTVSKLKKFLEGKKGKVQVWGSIDDDGTGRIVIGDKTLLI